MIVRPQDRFANAGFPTKFVESLSLGVPVMANGTSDIAEFLRDGRDGYLLYEPTAAAVEHAIMRAWQRTTDEKMQMRSAAWMRSRECFDYRRHAAELAEFVQGAQSCA
jgi:glycosyltransferase involved in cell wall biosynthesis